MAGYPYGTTLDAIVSILEAANTITSAINLSAGLSTTVAMVRDDDPESVNLAHEKLPAVFWHNDLRKRRKPRRRVEGDGRSNI